MPLYSLSLNTSRWGAGLGNELIPAAKSYWAGRSYGSTLIPHSWGLNPRRYRKLFNVARLDRISPLVVRSFCLVRNITREDWARHRIADYGELAAAALREHRSVNPFSCLVSSGMWVGYAAIDGARAWLRGILRGDSGASVALAPLHAGRLLSQLRLGVHTRSYDFRESVGTIIWRFNVFLSGAWLKHVISGLVLQFRGSMIFFFMFGDDSQGEQAELVQDSPQVRFQAGPDHYTADLPSLVSCDLLVCPASSYSLTVAGIGGISCLRMREQMAASSSALSFWCWEASAINGLMADAIAPPAKREPSPCIPVLLAGEWPDQWLADALLDGCSANRSFDPIRYGAVW